MPLYVAIHAATVLGFQRQFPFPCNIALILCDFIIIIFMYVMMLELTWINLKLIYTLCNPKDFLFGNGLQISIPHFR